MVYLYWNLMAAATVFYGCAAGLVVGVVTETPILIMTTGAGLGLSGVYFAMSRAAYFGYARLLATREREQAETTTA